MLKASLGIRFCRKITGKPKGVFYWRIMIYFVQEKGLFRSRVKIGFTDNIKGRLSGLRGGSPSALKLLLLLSGTAQDEAGYHERFASYRLHGEWFRYGLKLRLFVWANQFGVSQVNPEIKTDSELEPKIEPEMGPKLEPEVELNREPEPVVKSAKYHPDNINAAIDNLLSDNPNLFPTKGDVSAAVGIKGGSKYKIVIAVYEDRKATWQNSLPEPTTPNADEMKAIEAFVSVRDGGKFYWKDATRLAFGDGRFGKNYTIKLKRILDKFDVDYSNLSKEEIYNPFP